MSHDDPTDTASQQQALAASEMRRKLAVDTEEADWKWLMGSKRGRRMVWRLLDSAGVYRLSFNTNAMSMAFAEGGRNYGLHVLAQIHAICPDLYVAMMQEQNDHDARKPDDGRRHKHQ